jgi:hypothetical protein
MDGVIWFFLALLVALTITGVVVGLRRRRSGVDPMSRQCSNCRTPMSPRRMIFFVGRAARAAYATLSVLRCGPARTPVRAFATVLLTHALARRGESKA